MATPSRRQVRTSHNGQQASELDQRKVQKLRERLARERSALARWQTRLRRAFNAFEKSQRQVARLEKKLRVVVGGV
jgi:exonuclease VII large subunit